MRKFTRVLLIITGGVAVTAAVMAARLLGFQEGPTWLTIAAALAVIVSLITAWNGQRLFELQEDARKPYPYPYIDFASRYQVMQLRVLNYGGTPARDIFLEWEKPILDAQGQQVRFTEQQGTPDISVLLPNQSVAIILGVDSDMYKKHEDMNYSGIIKFKNVSEKSVQYPFYISAEQYRRASSYEEALKTHYRLQQIPEELKKLNQQIKRILDK